MADLAAVLGARPAALARELTKLHEEVLRASLPQLAERLAEKPVKGEAAIVVGPPQASEVTDAEIAARLDTALSDMSLRDAAKVVAETLGVPKTRVYDLGVRRERTSE